MFWRGQETKPTQWFLRPWEDCISYFLCAVSFGLWEEAGPKRRQQHHGENGIRFSSGLLFRLSVWMKAHVQNVGCWVVLVHPGVMMLSCVHGHHGVGTACITSLSSLLPWQHLNRVYHVYSYLCIMSYKEDGFASETWIAFSDMWHPMLLAGAVWNLCSSSSPWVLPRTLYFRKVFVLLTPSILRNVD